MKYTLTDCVYDIRHSAIFMAFTMIFMPLMITNYQFSVTNQAVFTHSLERNVSSTEVWWTTVGISIPSAIAAICTGFWVTFRTTKPVMLLASVVGLVGTIVNVAYNVPATAAFAQFLQSVWTGVVLTCSVAYIARTVAVNLRTRYYCLLYTWGQVAVTMICFAAQVLLQQHSLWPPRIRDSNILFLVFVCVNVLALLIFPEKPLEVYPDAVLTVRQYCGAGKALVAMVLSMVFVCAVYFGSAVYASLLQNGALNINFGNNTPQIDLVLNLVLFIGAFGIIVYMIVVSVVSSYVDDRKNLVFHALFTIVGLLVSINYPGQSLTWTRYLIGALFVTIGLNMMLGIGTGLLSKVIPPPFVGIWMGTLVAAEQVLVLIAAVWVNPYTQFRPSMDIPFVVTLCLIFVTLFSLIPVYRNLLPQMYSPWSGGALPTKHGLPAGPSAPLSPRHERGVPLLGIGLSSISEPRHHASVVIVPTNSTLHRESVDGEMVVRASTVDDYHSLD